MPQQIVQVDYSPLQAAGRAFGQIPGQIASGIAQYEKSGKINARNQQLYNEAVNFFNRAGVDYDPESLRPQPGEENYEERAKKATVPVVGQLAARGVDVKALVDKLKAPTIAWDQIDLLLKTQAGQKRQEAITTATGAALGPGRAMSEAEVGAMGISKLPAEQYAAMLTEPATFGRVFGRPAPKTESEFYGRAAEEFGKLPDVSAEDIAANPSFALAQKQFGARTEESKYAAAQDEKTRQMRLKMAMDIWDKVKAGNKVYKAGTLVDKPEFYDIFENPEVYSVETGVAPRAPGGRGTDRDRIPASLEQANRAETQLNQLRSGRDMLGNKIPYNEDEYRAKQNEVAMWKLAGDLEVRDKTFDEAYTMATRAIDINMVIDEAKPNEPVVYDESGKVQGLNWANAKVRQGLIAAVLAGGTAADVLSTMRKLRGLNPPRLVAP
jgi:hypothetical protein